MSNVASLSLCKELYELSGWTSTDYVWRYHQPTSHSKLILRAEQKADDYRFRNSREAPRFREENKFYPAYGLGYLLRKLPVPIPHEFPNELVIVKDASHNYSANYEILDDDTITDIITMNANTPESAACKLAIALIKQGVLHV